MVDLFAAAIQTAVCGVAARRPRKTKKLRRTGPAAAQFRPAPGPVKSRRRSVTPAMLLHDLRDRLARCVDRFSDAPLLDDLTAPPRQPGQRTRGEPNRLCSCQSASRSLTHQTVMAIRLGSLRTTGICGPRAQWSILPAPARRTGPPSTNWFYWRYRAGSRQAHEGRRCELLGRKRSGGKGLAPQVGLEPTTLRLTAECSTIELLRSALLLYLLYRT